MRIAIAGISTECSTFSPLLTSFDQFHLVRGPDLVARYPYLANLTDVEVVPILRARALPGGPVEQPAYRRFKDEVLEGLRAGAPWDGVYLDLHGAMYVAGMEDAEGDWSESIRAAVGPGCLISASYDLHGNISQRLFDNLDLLTAFRTAPHIDYAETEERAASLLVGALRSGERPYKALVRVPVILPGERTSTEWEPGASLYAQLEHLPEGVLDASILVGYVWADEPRASASVVAYGPDQSAVQREAARLARAYWDARGDFNFGVQTASVDDCIEIALGAPEACVFISDSGDNPTAGGVGDVPYSLGRLIEIVNSRTNPETAVYASIIDPAAVGACFEAGQGTELELSLGGKLDHIHGQPLTVRGRVAHLVEMRWKSNPALRNRQVVFQVGSVSAILTEQRTPFHFIADFQALGIEPLQHKIVMIKIGYLQPDLKRAAPRALLALSPGAVNQDITRLPYKRIARPMYPLDPEMTWRP